MVMKRIFSNSFELFAQPKKTHVSLFAPNTPRSSKTETFADSGNSTSSLPYKHSIYKLKFKRGL
jgi:hypothetical protein